MLLIFKLYYFKPLKYRFNPNGTFDLNQTDYNDIKKGVCINSVFERVKSQINTGFLLNTGLFIQG